MRISDWSSDVCSSDLARPSLISTKREDYAREELVAELGAAFVSATIGIQLHDREAHAAYLASWLQSLRNDKRCNRSAAHTSELQSLMRTSYAAFCEKQQSQPQLQIYYNSSHSCYKTAINHETIK